MSGITTERPADNESELVPLKSAAHSLGLTVEGARRLLLRLCVGVRQGGRWFIDSSVLQEMCAAQVVLGTHGKKEPCHSRDVIAAKAGQKVNASTDEAIVKGHTGGRKNPKPTQVARWFSVYDGRDCLGTVKILKNGPVHAFDCRGKLLGIFPEFQSAFVAIGAAVSEPSEKLS
jgi:hypothetical protein